MHSICGSICQRLLLSTRESGFAFWGERERLLAVDRLKWSWGELFITPLPLVKQYCKIMKSSPRASQAGFPGELLKALLQISNGKAWGNVTQWNRWNCQLWMLLYETPSSQLKFLQTFLMFPVLCYRELRWTGYRYGMCIMFNQSSDAQQCSSWPVLL